MLVKAIYEIERPGTAPFPGTVIYSVNDGERVTEEAIAAFKRWWDYRHKSYPETFGKLKVVLLYEFIPSRVSQDGLTATDIHDHFYEWRHTDPLPLGYHATAKTTAQVAPDRRE